MSDNNNIYSQLGVSSQKEDVHKAIEKLDKGLFPGAFCKIVKDVNGRTDYCSIFHADGAGTKSSLAYMYYKETNDINIFRGIVRDAIVMNTDDILCVGAMGPIFLSNNLGRNSSFITGDIIATIINEYNNYSQNLTDLGLPIVMCGGETADVGDIVKTLVLDASVFTTMKRADVIDATHIQSTDVIIGLASSGKATYEEIYNSGLSSNGLTLARHGTLSHEYYKKYPECYNHKLDEKVLFFGKHLLTDMIQGIDLTIGEALLSPTRTYAPVLIDILKHHRDKIHGLIHNTGGGQTKDLHYGINIKYIKNNLFPIPKIFQVIQTSSETQWKEMFSVFNMGHRMEIFCNESDAKEMINIARKYNIEAKIIGHCEPSPLKDKNIVEITSEVGSFEYK